MFEKVNPYHPDKVADRIAGALVDVAYRKAENPKIAVEVLIGHEQCNIIIETSEDITQEDCRKVVLRIAGVMPVYSKIVKQDKHLADNQNGGLRCGDNGIFKGMPVTDEQQLLTDFAKEMAEAFKSDGKYIVDNYRHLIICQSKATEVDIKHIAKEYETAEEEMIINPLGYWTGGTGVDSGATNRKLGSDMGNAVTGGGLHGKDFSKSDVTLNIVCHLEAQKTGMIVTACCAIGDKDVEFKYGLGERTERLSYEDCVRMARRYMEENFGGSFERFSEYGLISPRI